MMTSPTFYCFSNAQDPDDAHIIAIWADMVKLLSVPVATCYGQVLYHVLLQSTSKSSEPLSHTGQLKRTGGTAFEEQRL